MEKPNKNFFPKSETPVFPLKKVSLNKLNTNTPFLISPNIAERSYIFTEKAKLEQKTTPTENYNVDWEKGYDDLSTVFVPENRWAHEVTRPPEEIKNNKYKIYLDADVKVQASKNGLELITRTLLPYVEINKDPNQSLIDFYNLNQDKYVPFFYNWVFRWTPRNNCKLLFYSDDEIEDTSLIKVPNFIIDYKNSDPNIKIPFFVSKDLFPKKTLILHDSAIMYLEIIN